MTFHGAGDVGLAQRLLGELARAHVHVTVLAVGTWLTANPHMAEAILGGAHELGNHTLHHYPMLELSAATARAEVAGCAAVLQRLTGSRQRWFRASGTQETTAVIREAAATGGYGTCLSYDVDGLDWQDPPSATVVAAVLQGSRPGSVISLHLGHLVTIRALPGILSGLAARGLRPVTCSELLS